MGTPGRFELTPRRYRLLAWGLSILAGLAVVAIAVAVFPYHSVNNDEGVYLQQAAMLLEGALRLTPEPIPIDAVHPWFFVDGPDGLYSKYTPVPAAMFAVGLAVGQPRLVLGLIGAGIVACTYALGTAAYDRRTGVIAAAAMGCSPMFLMTTATFLPYAPTTLLNLVFAVAYVRAARRAHRGYAAFAGLSIGLAFFARPYTAVLFASPFVTHATWRAWRARRDPRVVSRYGLIAAGGLLLVGVTLGYNAIMTGSAWRFPYEAFAPLDGLGFGRRRLLGHERTYTPTLAVAATIETLRRFAADWLALGVLGALAALIGAAVSGRALARRGVDRSVELNDAQLRGLLLGVGVAVVLGEAYFWGTLNVLGGITDVDDGFVSLFGPFYHFDLLVPAAIFGAHGAVWVADGTMTRVRARTPVRCHRTLIAAAVVMSVVVIGTAGAATIGPPFERNAAYADMYATADEPLRDATFTDAVVLLPGPYGDWLNHPIQWRRNDPGFDGSVIYALDRGPDGDFAVLDALPERRPYRYTYHGEWTDDPADRVLPRLQPLAVRAGPTLESRTVVRIPDRIEHVAASLSNGETTQRFAVDQGGADSIAIRVRLAPSGVTAASPAFATPGGSLGLVPITGVDEIALTVTLVEPGGATLTYRVEVTVRRTDAGVEAIWPPVQRVCRLVSDCDRSGTYLPDRPGTRPTGIGMNTTLNSAVGDR